MQNQDARIFNKAKQFINKSFNNNIDHFDKTLYWVKELKPGADIPLMVAAYSHDIERALRKHKQNKFETGQILDHHQRQGGIIMYDFLIKQCASKKLATQVKNLISKHESGGSTQQNILKDADSISYFETNALKHLNFIVAKKFSIHNVKDKNNWMYNRITSPKTKQNAKPLYQKAKQKL